MCNRRTGSESVQQSRRSYSGEPSCLSMNLYYALVSSARTKLSMSHSVCTTLAAATAAGRLAGALTRSMLDRRSAQRADHEHLSPLSRGSIRHSLLYSAPGLACSTNAEYNGLGSLSAWDHSDFTPPGPPPSPCASRPSQRSPGAVFGASENFARPRRCPRPVHREHHHHHLFVRWPSGAETCVPGTTCARANAPRTP